MLIDYDELLTVQEVCDILMVGKNTIYDLIKHKKIDAFRPTGGRTWKIPKDSLIIYIKQSSNLADCLG